MAELVRAIKIKSGARVLCRPDQIDDEVFRLALDEDLVEEPKDEEPKDEELEDDVVPEDALPPSDVRSALEALLTVPIAQLEDRLDEQEPSAEDYAWLIEADPRVGARDIYEERVSELE